MKQTIILLAVLFSLASCGTKYTHNYSLMGKDGQPSGAVEMKGSYNKGDTVGLAGGKYVIYGYQCTCRDTHGL